ncbi:peptidase inhibitor I9 [Labedella gwakjiensis]|uniref:Peptidase inhibitor I9 n=1 Tax=Labedella gwakjiensis TaxID=390269 RepID=A0A2P8GRS2_9MICO|nr:S8 family serine peptidase [Labedella gwakjiensis]PSL36666.1 peptidase inhibitor I9 [Labedella gwakjiensis]RUQ84187.1 serine protease [Labedella gwakjiensis]
MGFIGGTAASAAPTTPFSQQSGKTTYDAGRYVVTLVDDAAATYDGGVSGFDATKPGAGDKLNPGAKDVTEYTDYLTDEQKDVAAEVDATIDYSYTLTVNAFAADLTSAQASALSADKRVVALEAEEILHPTAQSSTDFLGLSGEGGVWEGVGGVDAAGAGVVVGVLDTGIAPENPSFAGDPLTTTPSDEPFLDGDEVIYTKADGGTFRGICEEGEQFSASDCSTKVIGARYFLDGFGADRIGDASVGEYVSPRDGDGHGSHTASTAAGNYGVDASVSGVDYGQISGVAPAAKIAAYKVCWSGPDPAVTTDDGCASTDLLAGIEQAVADGVDVINYSIGGGSATTTVSATDYAFFGAAAAGIFVSASAGNDGPDSSTLDNASPWITTVAASTIPSYEATVELGDGSAYPGASITVDRTEGAEPLAGELVWAGDAAADGVADANLCGPDSLNADLVAGQIVVCDRGTYDRVAKSAEVARAGGIGLVLVNPIAGSIDLDEHSVPTVHVDVTYHDAIVTYAQTEGATATFLPDNVSDYPSPPSPQVAGFSSRGPVLADGSDILKPDVSAPGVAILAGGANAEGADPTFKFLSGTSMAAPHVAGLGALYLGVHPTATPAEIKSALMTTASNTVDADGDDVTDPFVQGAGQVEPTSYFDAGLLYLNDVDDWASYIEGVGYELSPDVEPIDPSSLNLASIAIGSLTAPETITRTVTATKAGSYTAQPIEIPGITAEVTPSSFTIAEGESVSYTVTFTRTDAPLDEFSTGSLVWKGTDGTTVRSPIAVQPVTIVAPDEVSGTGITGNVAVEVTPGGTGPIPLEAQGLAPETLVAGDGSAEGHTGSGSGGDEFEYPVSVPEGASLARFSLIAVDKTADLDLIVYQLDGDGNPVAGWQSATGSADEQVDIWAPEAGDYLVIAQVYSGTTAFDVRTAAVVPGQGEGDFAVDPTELAGVQGEPSTYTASWAGLEPLTNYVGLVLYGDTGEATVVSVASGEAPEPEAPVNVVAPTISGTPAVGKKLTATPGEWDTEGLTFAYQWQADGVDIAGATSATYTVKRADQGKSLTVVVTASAEGLPSGTATSAAVTVLFASKVSLSVSPVVGFSWSTYTATVKVTSSSDTPATGKVVITVGSKKIEAVLDANGTAKVKLPKLRSGIHTVKVSYAGDATHTAATSSPRLVLVII